MTDQREQPTARSPQHPHPAYVAYEWVLALFLVLGAVQIFLAGFGVWSLGSGPGFDPHRVLGFTLAGLSLVILVLAIVAGAGRRAVIIAALLVVLTGFVQSLLAGLGDEGAFWGGLHALDGLIVLGLAGFLHGAARKGAPLP
jgi:Family of unknown function (DUF6220)